MERKRNAGIAAVLGLLAIGGRAISLVGLPLSGATTTSGASPDLWGIGFSGAFVVFTGYAIYQLWRRVEEVEGEKKTAVALLGSEKDAVIAGIKATLADEIGKQDALNAVAKLRHDGVQLYANQPSVPTLSNWIAQVATWHEKARALLEEHFEYAVVEWFEDRGPLAQVGFMHAINEDHHHQLTMLMRDLSILESLIDKNTRLMRVAR